MSRAKQKNWRANVPLASSPRINFGLAKYMRKKKGQENRRTK